MEEIGRCGDCQHWEPPTRRVDFWNLWSDEADPKYGRCALIELAQSYDEPPDPLPLAATKDGSDYKADLFTQAEFGCVLFSPRPV